MILILQTIIMVTFGSAAFFLMINGNPWYQWAIFIALAVFPFTLEFKRN